MQCVGQGVMAQEVSSGKPAQGKGGVPMVISLNAIKATVPVGTIATSGELVWGGNVASEHVIEVHDAKSHRGCENFHLLLGGCIPKVTTLGAYVYSGRFCT